MCPHDKVEFPFFHEVGEMLFYFLLNGSRLVYLPYNVPGGFIEFPVEQDYSMSSARLFSFTPEKKPDLNRHSGGFLPFFQKISHEIEILLPVIGFGAVHIYLDIQDFRLYYSKARSLNIQ